VAILAGTNFGFSPRDDHHLGMVNIRLGTATDDDVVTVEGTFGVRDWSNDWDDDYEGSIQFVLLADLEAGFVPSNLSITGLEFNQTIQFYRSQLDPATAQTDNAIALISGKNTVVRAYVDTQTDPSRPTVTQVSGVFEIRLPGEATWNPVMILNGPILPKRDVSISRRSANDTLNFLIPGPFAAGTLEYRLRVFDALHSDQPGYTSGTVQGTLQFVQVAPLRVRGVGINYTGAGGPIGPPDVAALRSTLSFATKNYPVGQVVITGFDVIDYGGDFTDQSGDGCGTGWDGLLEQLQEMQGDSDDVYYGLVPSAVPRGWGGCGGGDGRVAAGPVGAGPTAAQEIAHAFGREHAPCPPPGQPNSPGNIDPNYPTYDALMSGSIGEVGINDIGAVRDPTVFADFMSYCGSRWVSPYTYDGLRQGFPPVPTSPFRDIQSLIERPTEPSQHLFLNFRIYRGGRIEVLPSFHFPAQPTTTKPGRWTPYGVELRDAHSRVIHAQRIWLTDNHKTLDSAFICFYKPIPFHEDTSRVVFTCGASGDCDQKDLLSIDVPRDAPKVNIVSPEKSRNLSGKVRVAWKAHFRNKPLHYLLRYSNDDGQTWRAVAGRLDVNEYVVDLDRLPGGEFCRFQVLATEGIRTGGAVSGFFSVPQRPRVTNIVSPPAGTVVASGELVTLLGESFSPDTGSAAETDLQWHSDLDGALGIGHEFYLRTLRPGVHTITLRTSDGCGGESAATVQVEVKEQPARKHTSWTHPGHTSRDHDAGRIPPERKGDRQNGD